MVSQSSSNNRLLASMGPTDFAALSPHLAPVDLPVAADLVFPGRRIEHCWFIENGIVSLVTDSRDGHESETGIVGCEGMVDVAAILGAGCSPLRCFVQVAGRGYRLPVSVLHGQMDASPAMRNLLNHYVFDCFVDVSQTALANAVFTLEERLARWLLMCSDRLDRNEIALTHEFLSIMLNVRRAGVTVALHALRSAGLLEIGRGSITITDRPGLEQIVHDAYRPMVRR